MSSVPHSTSASAQRCCAVLVARLGHCARRFGLILALFLGLFHLRLLWGRMVEGALLRPEVGIRWLAALGLALGLVLLQRRGLSWVRGRGASAVWLLVFLLHVGVAEPATDLSVSGAGPVELLLLLPAAVVVAATRRVCLRRRNGGSLLSSIRSLLFYLGKVADYSRPALRSSIRILTSPRAPPRGRSVFFA